MFLRFQFFWCFITAVFFAQTAHAEVFCGAINGIALPCWTEFLGAREGEESLPLYPYAKRTNGCSIPGAMPGEYDNLFAFGYDFNFRNVCDAHDKCYYTLGTYPSYCNEPFSAGLREVCEKGARQSPREDDEDGRWLSRAISNCHTRANVMSTAVIRAENVAHRESQSNQRRYLQKVEEFLSQQ